MQLEICKNLIFLTLKSINLFTVLEPRSQHKLRKYFDGVFESFLHYQLC